MSNFQTRIWNCKQATPNVIPSPAITGISGIRSNFILPFGSRLFTKKNRKQARPPKHKAVTTFLSTKIRKSIDAVDRTTRFVLSSNCCTCLYKSVMNWALRSSKFWWQLQPFQQGHSSLPGLLKPLWGTSLEDSWNHGIERNSQGIRALTCSHALCRKGWGPPLPGPSHSMLSGRKCNLNYST